MAEQRWCGPGGEHHAGAGVFVREVAGAMQQVDGAQHLASQSTGKFRTLSQPSARMVS